MELEDLAELTDLREEIMNQVLAAIKDAQDYREGLYKYAYLWQDNREEFMEQFLLYGKVLTQEDIEAHGEEAVPTNPPTLKEFKGEVGISGERKTAYLFATTAS